MDAAVTRKSAAALEAEGLRIYDFGSPGLDALHRIMRQDWRGSQRSTYQCFHRYIVRHKGVNGAETFYTLNTMHPGQASVQMEDIGP